MVYLARSEVSRPGSLVRISRYESLTFNEVTEFLCSVRWARGRGLSAELLIASSNLADPKTIDLTKRMTKIYRTLCVLARSMLAQVWL